MEHKMIVVDNEVWKRLSIIKINKNLKSLNELIKSLIKEDE